MITELITTPGSPKLFISDRALASWERLPGDAQQRVLEAFSRPNMAAKVVSGETDLREVMVSGYRVYFQNSAHTITIFGVLTPREASRLGI